MDKLIGLLFGVLLASLVSADENDFRCLKSVGLKNPLRLQFTYVTDQEGVGNVAYKNGSGRIAIRRTQETELRRGPKGRPSEFETRWQEIAPEGSGGTYIVVSQGAILSEFRYVRQKDGKQFKFEEDSEASTENGCNWQ